MRHFRELARGLGLAVLTALTVLGGLTLALRETGLGPPTLTPNPSITFAPGTALSIPSPIVPTFASNNSTTPQPNLPTTTLCPPPFGWLAVTVTESESLPSLAARYGLTAQAAMQANCLSTENVFAGQIIFLPPIPVTPPTALPPCGPPPGWVYYSVQPGDNLFRLSLKYGTTIAALQAANCLTDTYIAVGRRLFVPPVTAITDTPAPSATPSPSSTPSPTLTPAFTNTFAPSATAQPTETPSLTPTETLTATASHTIALTATDTETATATATEPPTATETFTATATPP